MTRLFSTDEPITGATNQLGNPTHFTWHGRRHRVEAIVQRWQVDTDWWQDSGREWRDYFTVLSSTGLLIVIYHNLITDTWHVSRLYD